MKLFSCLIMALSLSGCSSLLPDAGKPPQKFTLEVLQIPSYCSSSYDVIIDTPTIDSSLDTTRIAVKPTPQEINYYAEVEWADRPTDLLQSALLYSFQNTPGIRSATRPLDGVKGHFILKIEIQKFYVAHQPTPYAFVQYVARAVDPATRVVIESKMISHQALVQEQTGLAVVQAFNQAHLQAAEDLIRWFLTLPKKERSL